MADKFKGKTIVGLSQKITIIGKKRSKSVVAKVDTGATKGSIDSKLASSLQLGPVIKTKLVKSAHGNEVRPVISADIKIKNKNIKADFTLADRSHLKYSVLLGQNILKKGFIIDPSKK